MCARPRRFEAIGMLMKWGLRIQSVGGTFSLFFSLENFSFSFCCLWLTPYCLCPPRHVGFGFLGLALNTHKSHPTHLHTHEIKISPGNGETGENHQKKETFVSECYLFDYLFRFGPRLRSVRFHFRSERHEPTIETRIIDDFQYNHLLSACKAAKLKFEMSCVLSSSRKNEKFTLRETWRILTEENHKNH